MDNPYQPLGSEVTNSSTSGKNGWHRRQWLTATASVLAIVVTSIVSVVLINQALRLNAEGANLPARFQIEFASNARSSWIGGFAAGVGALLNAVALVLVVKNKLVVSMTLLAITLIGMIAMAIIFKPR